MKSVKNSVDNQLNFEIKHKSLFFYRKFTLSEIDSHYKEILNLVKDYKWNSVTIELSGVTDMDSAGVAVIETLKNNFLKKGITVEIEGASDKIKKVLEIFSIPPKDKKHRRKRKNLFESTGQKVYSFFTETLLDFIYLTADLFYWTIADLFQKKTSRKGEFVNQAVNIGVNAVPIVGLISFLIGLVLALQSSAQLRQFGANIFIVDLVVISMTAEMGPLITAIMIAGRSGSAIASETATMTVTEEVDALKTMGLNPLRYIIIPKMHASIFTLPFLTIFANILGILGGMVVAYLYLDISFPVFYNRMTQALYFKDIFTGFIKSLVFAGLIVETGAFFGLRVRGGSVGVGRYTTKAVVASIFLVILADSVLGLLFY